MLLIYNKLRRLLKKKGAFGVQNIAHGKDKEDPRMNRNIICVACLENGTIQNDICKCLLARDFFERERHLVTGLQCGWPTINVSVR